MLFNRVEQHDCSSFFAFLHSLGDFSPNDHIAPDTSSNELLVLSRSVLPELIRCGHCVGLIQVAIARYLGTYRLILPLYYSFLFTQSPSQGAYSIQLSRYFLRCCLFQLAFTMFLMSPNAYFYLCKLLKLRCNFFRGH